MNTYIKVCSLVTILLLTLNLNGSNINGIVKDAKTKEVLPGANILIEGTKKGTTSDINGQFNLTLDAPKASVIVKYIGYKPAKLKILDDSFVTVLLEPDLELQEFTHTARHAGSFIKRLEPVHSEHITSVELGKAACCTLSESFETNATVDVGFTDAVTGAKQIKMLGLAGKYVQINYEKLPGIRGPLQRFGLDYIPGPWMNSISVSKGTSSVVDGYESLTGQIDINFKNPGEKPFLHGNLFASAEGRYETNFVFSKKLSNKASTALFTNTSYNNYAIDNNSDNFLDMPLIQRFAALNKWEHRSGNYFGHYYINYLNEERNSGNLDWYNNKQSENSYSSLNKSSNIGFQTKQGYITNSLKDASIAVLASINRSELSTNIGLQDVTTNENYGYLNLIYTSKFFNPDNTITTGINGTIRDLNEEAYFVSRQTNEQTIGAFGEYIYSPNHKLVLQAGLRVDYNTYFDKFLFTPRVHLKYEFTEDLHLRLSAGKGYRSPLLLAETSRYLASSRKINIVEAPNMEESVNYGGSIIWYLKSLLNSSLTLDFYHTSFLNKYLANLDTDAHKVNLYNINNGSFSNAFQVELKSEPLRNLETKLALRYNQVMETIDGELRDAPLTSAFKGLATISYLTNNKSWQFDVTGQYYGGGRLPDSDALNPLWDNTFGSYYTINSQVKKYFKKWEIYLGSENINNFRIPNAIIDAGSPYGNNFDAGMIWGPMVGRTVYLGINFNI